MNTTKILAFRKPLLMIVWLLAMQGAAFAQNLRETFFSPNGKIEWKAEADLEKHFQTQVYFGALSDAHGKEE